MTITVTIFKPSGKYYTNEQVEIPAGMEMWHVTDWLKANFTGYKGMTLVAMMAEHPNGVPIMIPGSDRT